MNEFFEMIYGDGKGYMVIVTESFQTERWFSWPDEAPVIERYLEMRVDEEVYCSTTLYSDKRRVSSNATEGRAVYADADTCVPSNFRAQPSIAVESSPGRWQTYWLLDKQHTAQELSEMSRKISIAHKDQGCDTGWILTKLLRVPGTTNLKYSVPFKVSATISGDIYSMEDLDKLYEDVKAETITVRDETVPELPHDALLHALGKMPDDLWNLYEDPVEEGQSWSERMWKLQNELFRAGLNPEEVFVIAKHAKCNKYGDESIGKTTQTGLPIPRRRDPDGTLWREVLRAEQSFDTGEPEPAPAKEAHQEIAFLTDEEREGLERTFIDEYVDWVASKTDAAPVYSRTMAYVLLSSIYGTWGHIYPQFGKVPLNIWALLLGDTTRTRKSTAHDMALYVLHAWERRVPEVGNIDLATDFTQEALTKELGPRDGLVSYVHRDEVQGFFNEVFTKSYQAGLLNYLAALYDGKVPVSLRATKGNSQRERATTIFNFVGIGIMSDVAENLTTKNFRDGFLARFTWALADAPMLTREGESLPQGDPSKMVKGEDPAITEFCKQFARVRRHIGHGEPQTILFSDEAFQRYDEWKWQTALMAKESLHNETLEPSRQRLAVTIWKAAALLAMHDLSTTIELKHLLPALEQAEYWYKDMARMVTMIASSDFQRKVDELEAYVGKGSKGRRTLATVYQHMLKSRGLRKGEVDELIDNLRSQGRVQRQGTHLEVIDT